MITGLSHNFSLASGKFALSSGSAKAKDSLYFLVSFELVSRIYLHEYAPNLSWTIQKPQSTIRLYKSLLLGRLRKLIIAYVPYITLTNSDITIYRDRSVNVTLEYIYNGVSKETGTLIKFI